MATGQVSIQRLPVVEVFSSIEGEGTMAGFPTTFVRLFNCNLRCKWCDTCYSYPPARPWAWLTIEEIASMVVGFKNKRLCLTGGEPLLHGRKTEDLIRKLVDLGINDLHIETNGSLNLRRFDALRRELPGMSARIRFIMDYKLPSSGEHHKNNIANFSVLREDDEVKFVVADEEDFMTAKEVIDKHHSLGLVLMGPVWNKMPPRHLAELILQHEMTDVKLNLQLQKIIWDVTARGV